MGVFLLVVGIICIVYGATIMLTWSGTAFFLVWYALGVVCGGTGAFALALPDSTLVRGNPHRGVLPDDLRHRRRLHHERRHHARSVSYAATRS